MHTRHRVTIQLILGGVAVGALAAQQLGLSLAGQAVPPPTPAPAQHWCCVEASEQCTQVMNPEKRERRDEAISSNRAEQARTPEQAERQTQRLDLAYASTLSTMLSDVIVERLGQLGETSEADRAHADFVTAEYGRVRQAMMASFANADALLAAANQALADAALLSVYHTIYEDTAAVIRYIANNPEETQAVRTALRELVTPPANLDQLAAKVGALRAKARELGIRAPLTDEEFAALAGRAVQPGPSQTAAKDRMLEAGLQAFPNLQAGLDSVQGSRDVLTGRTTLHEGAIDAAWSFAETGEGRAGLTMVSALGREGMAAVLAREPDARERAERLPADPDQPGGPGGPGGDDVHVDVQTGPDGTHVTVDVEPGAGGTPVATATGGADGQAIAREVRGHLRRLTGIDDGNSTPAEESPPASCAQIAPVGTQPFTDIGPFPTREACMQGCRALSSSSTSSSDDSSTSVSSSSSSSSEIIGGEERSSQASATISVTPPNQGVLQQNGYGSSISSRDYNNMEFSSVLGDNGLGASASSRNYSSMEFSSVLGNNGLQSLGGQPLYIPATPADCIRYAKTDMRNDPRWNCDRTVRGW